MKDSKLCKSEFEKMLAGLEYDSRDPELFEMRKSTREALKIYNDSPTAQNLEKVLGYKAENLIIVPPFQCEYGHNIKFGKNVFVNFNFSLLSSAEIEIGDNCYIGPNVGIYTAMHPIEPDRRRLGINFAKPVKICDGAWLGGGVIVLPGVTIGRNSVIGAGSVVTRSVPDNCVAVGNPCRVIKTVDNGER